MDLEVQDRKQNPLPKKVIETKATTEASTELPTCHLTLMSLKLKLHLRLHWVTNMSPDSYVIETEAPKSDMINVDLKTPGCTTKSNPKPNPMPKKTMTQRYKFKRIKKGGKVQKIQFLGFTKWSPNLLTEIRGSMVKETMVCQ